MDKNLRGMYSHLADEIYKKWKEEEPQAIAVLNKLKDDLRLDYILCGAIDRKNGVYSVELAIIGCTSYSFDSFELHKLSDDMEFDDWYQLIDMNYTITQGILDELGIDYVIDNAQWHMCFDEAKNDTDPIRGGFLAINLRRDLWEK